MYGTFDIIYKGVSGSDIGVYAVKRPSIPSPQRRVEKVVVPGRDGSLFIEDGWDDVSFDVIFNWFDTDDELSSKTRLFNDWLSTSGGQLMFTDDTDYFRIVKRIEMRQAERIAPQIMKQTVRFTVDPWQYSSEGNNQITRPASLTNDSNWPAYPLIMLTSGGNWTIGINGNTISAHITDGIIIDTAKETATWGGQNLSALVTGDISKLILDPGDNSITWNSGCPLVITPRWRTL